MPDKPNCYKCQHIRPVPGSAHNGCANAEAKVIGAKHGIRNGWFFYPYDFDPCWLISCDGFVAKEAVHASN